jgi:hypothetical protein
VLYHLLFKCFRQPYIKRNVDTKSILHLPGTWKTVAKFETLEYTTLFTEKMKTQNRPKIQNLPLRYLFYTIHRGWWLNTGWWLEWASYTDLYSGAVYTAGIRVIATVTWGRNICVEQLTVTRSEVLSAVRLKIQLLWEAALCRWKCRSRLFESRNAFFFFFSIYHSKCHSPSNTSLYVRRLITSGRVYWNSALSNINKWSMS